MLVHIESVLLWIKYHRCLMCWNEGKKRFLASSLLTKNDFFLLEMKRVFDILVTAALLAL